MLKMWLLFPRHQDGGPSEEMQGQDWRYQLQDSPEAFWMWHASCAQGKMASLCWSQSPSTIFRPCACKLRHFRSHTQWGRQGFNTSSLVLCPTWSLTLLGVYAIKKSVFTHRYLIIFVYRDPNILRTIQSTRKVCFSETISGMWFHAFSFAIN